MLSLSVFAVCCGPFLFVDFYGRLLLASALGLASLIAELRRVCRKMAKTKATLHFANSIMLTRQINKYIKSFASSATVRHVACGQRKRQISIMWNAMTRLLPCCVRPKGWH